MPPALKLPCSNSDFQTYSGKEISPLGLGISPHSEKVGSRMMGRDGTQWLNSVKNGEKVWVRSPPKVSLAKDVPIGETIAIDALSLYYNVSENATSEVKPVVVTPPKEKASAYDDGYEKAHSGHTYVVKSDKNGRKKWMRKAVTPAPSPAPAPTAAKKPSPDEDTAPLKKKRKTRAPTLYNIFIGQMLTKLHREEPTMPKTDCMKMAISQWKALSDEEKQSIGR